MVSFSCEGCGDVLTKKKLDPHRNQCRGASFSCLDCMTHFQGTEYRSHTSCISEAQKYQGALYKPEKEKRSKNTPSTPRRAYVEDESENDARNSHIVIVEPSMPPAPSPPSAVPHSRRQAAEVVNVFDFLVNNDTPNASRTELCAPEPMSMIEDTPQPRGPNELISRGSMRVRFDGASQSVQSLSDLVEYGSGPVPNGKYQTPAPRAERERRKEHKDRAGREDKKKDKKRKRLHIETTQDEIMTDAPPILHSGLSGGLKNLLTRPSVFPPSPDYSGGDAGDHDPDTPGSPLKKPKHSRRGRVDTIGHNLVSLMAPSGVSSVQSREHSSETRRRKRRHHRRERDGSVRASSKNQVVHYQPDSREVSASADRDAEGDAQMILYRPRAEMLLEFVNKGPESERGVSMNKALKRYHRERFGMGLSLGKGEEEKELWKSLRMRRNERGEVVLFLD